MKSKSETRFGLYFLIATLALILVGMVAIHNVWEHAVVVRAVKTIVYAGGEVSFDQHWKGMIIPYSVSEPDDLSSEAVMAWRSLPVGVIDLSGIPVAPEAMKAVAHLSPFRCLNLHNAKLTNEGWEILLEQDCVNDLWIGGKYCTDEQLAKLDRLSNLTELSIWNTHFSETTCMAIGKLSRLKRLELHSFTIVKDGFAYLSNLANLEQLSLSSIEGNSELAEEDMQALSGLTNLRCIHLDSVSMSNDAWIPLKFFPPLEDLHLINIDIDDLAFEHIAAMTNLDLLCFAHSDLTGDGPGPFGRMTNVHKLVLVGPKYNDDTLKRLYTMKTLQTLVLSSTETTDESREMLKQALPSVELIVEDF